jgi:outer membrane protein OmpA-like peptidoglycan-associated protein
MENLDLFSFPLPMGGQPQATTTFRGSLTDGMGNPYDGIVSIIDLDDGIEVAPKFLRPDGSFEFNLINEKNYLLIIQGNNFFRIEELFKMEEGLEINTETEPISSRIKFESIEFENGKAEILPSMYEDLQRIMEFMGDNPNFSLKISGHTDSRGNIDSNLKLSQDRADRIKDFIAHFGNIDEERIEAFGYGSSQPIVVEKSDADRKLNRRVEFEITMIPDGEWSKLDGGEDDGW